MAKDPAFLFYPGDWLGGTMGMTLEQKGCYLELLILQFNNGKFTKAQAKQVLSICFDVAWPMLMQKFSTDGTLFWNSRLNEEIERRRNFSKSRRDNALSTKNKKAYAKHMETETETENENENITGNENFLVPQMFEKFKNHLPKYLGSKEKDYKPLNSIANFLADQGKLTSATGNQSKIIEVWDIICQSIKSDKFYSQKSLSTISNHIQEITQIAIYGNSTNSAGFGTSGERNRAASNF